MSGKITLERFRTFFPNRKQEEVQAAYDIVKNVNELTDILRSMIGGTQKEAESHVWDLIIAGKPQGKEMMSQMEKIKTDYFLEKNISDENPLTEDQIRELMQLMNSNNNYCGSCAKIAEKCFSVCKKVFYCNKECQKKHWKVHKLNCISVSK